MLHLSALLIIEVDQVLPALADQPASLLILLQVVFLITHLAAPATAIAQQAINVLMRTDEFANTGLLYVGSEVVEEGLSAHRRMQFDYR